MPKTIEKEQIGGAEAAMSVDLGAFNRSTLFPKLEELRNSLTHSYSVLRGAIEAEQDHELDLAANKRLLQEKQHEFIRTKGDELGKNDKERAANLEALCEEWAKDVRNNERTLMQAKHDRELAALDVERDRALLRCIEAQVGINRWQERAER